MVPSDIEILLRTVACMPLPQLDSYKKREKYGAVFKSKLYGGRLLGSIPAVIGIIK